MTTDYRALCAELAEALCGYEVTSDDFHVIRRARAALAQPEPEVPVPAAVGEAAHIRRMCDIILGSAFGDEELDSLALLVGHHPDVLNASPAPAEGEVGEGPTDEELDRLEHPHWEETGVEEWGRREAIFNHRSYARAVLARWGNHSADASKMVSQPAPPAEGEVVPVPTNADQAALMAILGEKWLSAHAPERLRHPAPVPVSERLPGPEDCDAEGRCWVHQPHEACPESPAWELMLAKYASSNYGAVCWLPAKALPLPQGEVE